MSKYNKYNIDSLKGLCIGTENEQIEGQVTIETLEDGKYLPEHMKLEKKSEPEPILLDTKKVSFSTLAVLYDKAVEKARKNGQSISEVITNLLIEYISQ